MRRDARHHHHHNHDHYREAEVDLCLLDRVLQSPNYHDYNYYYDHDDDAPGAVYDEPLAGSLRVRGRPMGQRRLHHHHDHHHHHDDDDHDDDDHHHDDHYHDYDAAPDGYRQAGTGHDDDCGGCFWRVRGYPRRPGRDCSVG